MRPSLLVSVFILALPALAEEVVPAAVHDALAGALAENPKRVSSIRDLMEKDHPSGSEASTGLEDDLAVLDILSSTRTTQKEKGLALKKHAAKMNDPVAKERLLNLAGRVHEVELQDLIRKRRTNRVTGLLNRTWQTTSEVLTGQPRALAVAGTDAFFAVTGQGEPTVADKKIAYLAQMREAGGMASEEEIADGRKIVASLEEKKSKTLLKHWKKDVKRSEKQGDTSRAERLARIGTGFWPEEKEWFDSYASQPEELAEEGFVEAIAEDPAQTLLLRRKLADSEPGGRAISVETASKPVEEALAERRSKTLNYLLFGETGFGVSAHGVARSVAANGSDAPGMLGILQGAQTVLRGASLLFGNELGLEKAIDAYADVDRRTPQALTREDRLQWADLCAKAGRYKEALDILERYHLNDEKRKQKFRSWWGNAILKRAESLPAGKDRFHALKFVIEELKETSAADRALRLLAETPSTEKPLLQVQREDLRAYESQLAENGFSLKRDWWDGQKENGEIADEGVYWEDTGAVWYRVRKKSPWRNIPQDPARLPALTGLFERIEQESVARALAGKRRENRKFPLELEGSLGPSSSYMAPKIVQYELDQDEEGLFR